MYQIRKLDDKVIEHDSKIIAFLEERPGLTAIVHRPEPLSPNTQHLPEPDWRDKLLKDWEEGDLGAVTNCWV